MVKCYVTGDNHFGRKFQGETISISSELKQIRLDAFKNAVQKANDEKCDLFIVTGDMFDKPTLGTVGSTAEEGKQLIEKVAKILKGFDGTVLVLPGNHDFQDGDSDLWNEFKAVMSNNTIVLDKFDSRSLDLINGTPVVVYPAYCHKEQSNENNLKKIKDLDKIITKDTINIGIAHGTIEGWSKDEGEGQYFKMSTDELKSIPVDVWFIGHAHVARPEGLSEDEYKSNNKIFNAGTHQQTDINNNTKGYGFIVEIEKKGEVAEVKAKMHHTGIVHFHTLEVNVKPDDDDALKKALLKELSAYDDVKDKTIIKCKFSGMVRSEEFERKSEIYAECTQDYLLALEPNFKDLAEQLTIERINELFDEKGLIAGFMRSFLDGGTGSPDENAVELSLFYELVDGIKNPKKKKTGTGKKSK